METVETPREYVEAPGRCPECHAPLAHDQRYCLNCGARRGPLPPMVATAIDDLAQPAPVVIHALPEGDDEADDPDERLLPAPRTVSFAVMAMLAFGVVAGSLTQPGGVESLARNLVLSLPPSSPPTTIASTPSAGGGGGNAGSGAAPAPTPTTAASTPQQTSTVAATTTATTPTTTSGSPTGLLGLPPIKHVFLIVLSGQGYTQAFGVSTGHPYLAKTLRAQGELVQNYYSVAPSSLANGIALMSGQGPTAQTAANCPVFTDITPGTISKYSQVLGAGCAYPAKTVTLPNELTKTGRRWRAYIQGIQNGPKGQPATCRRPPLGVADPNQAARPHDPYVTWRNPFVYFDSLRSRSQCAKNDVALGRLATDLKKVSTTPALSYIAPDPCHDGSDTPCTTGAPAGLAQSDRFLKTVVPEIEKSPAYKQDGLIVVTFDQTSQTGPAPDTTSCCNQPAFPNLAGGGAGTGTGVTSPTGTTTTGTTTTGTTTTGTTTTGATSTGTTTASASGTGTTTSGTATTGTTTAGGSTTTTSSTSTTPANCPPPTTTTGTTTGTTTPTTTGTTTTTSTGAGTTTTTGTGTGTTGSCTGTGAPPAGGQVGALLISQYVKAGSADTVDPFNHFSLLKTIEDLFRLKHLGYSSDAALPEFDTAIFNANHP